MKLFLIVAKGKHQGMAIPITVDLFLMGSDTMCQLRSKMPGIAPQHCAVMSRDNKAFVRDLEGGETRINEELMPAGEEWPVHDGDRLVVGPLEFVFQLTEKQLSQRDAEEWALKSMDKIADKDMGEAAQDSELPAAAAAAASILGKLQSQRGVVKGRLRVSQNDDVTVIGFNDVFLVEEAEITLIKRELMHEIKRPAMRILLDFKNVQRMSSAAAEMILEIRRRLQTQSGTLALCRVRPELHVILDALKILQSVKHFADKEVAIDADW